ncbi:MAG: MMPL family transporter [Clostridia bacterium]|nr:MMPL family transporter [Clostridia bacterium]
MKTRKPNKSLNVKSKTWTTILVRILIGLLMVAIVAVSAVGYFKTGINYSLIDYLPANSDTSKGYLKVEECFGSASYARVMLKNVYIESTPAIKAKITNVEGVKFTLWLDDIILMALTPLEENLGGTVTSYEDLFNSLRLLVPSMDMPDEVMEFARLLDEGLTQEIDGVTALNPKILQSLNDNPEILDIIDLITKTYFDNAISLSNYYNVEENTALIEIYFEDSDYSLSTASALKEIQAICGKDAHYDGTAVSIQTAMTTTVSEIGKILLIVLPLAIVILLFSTKSIIDPLVLLISIGFAVIINMGTNYFLVSLGILPHGVSFITNSMVAALQMAISMDYSIFILHRYQDEVKAGTDERTAVRIAQRKSILPVAASCLTTVIGFIAISLMEFGIGKDIGLVFVKGTIISFVVAILCMPFLIGVFSKLTKRTEHRLLLPQGKALTRLIIKFGLPLIIFFVVLSGLSITQQDGINFSYGESAISASEGTKSYEDAQEIQDTFGIYNPIIILIPLQLREQAGNAEAKLVDELCSVTVNGKPIITRVMSYQSLQVEGVSLGALDSVIKQNFDSDGYTRILVNVNAIAESPESFEVLSKIKNEILPKYCMGYDYYMTGSTVAAYDLKNISKGEADKGLLEQRDYGFVNTFAIVAVFLVIMLTFRSIALPILLVATIECGIFINMTISALSGNTIAFLGYMVVSLIQLGATIDYAILYTQNYVNSRRLHNKNIATYEAMRLSLGSIFTSSLILCAAGFSIYFSSSVQGVAEIGLMVGRGALISGIMCLTFLPALLRLCDKYINLLSLKMNFKMPGKSIMQEENSAIAEINQYISLNDLSEQLEETTTTSVSTDNNAESPYTSLQQQLEQENIDCAESKLENSLAQAEYEQEHNTERVEGEDTPREDK